MRKKVTSLLIYVSLAFLFFYLYKLDYFAFNKVTFNMTYLLESVLLLWTGFLVSCISWWNILDIHNINIKVNLGIISHGLAVFAKYIPGKVWVILGRASYISQRGYSLKTTSFLSLKEQLIYLWLGLLISTIPVIILYRINEYTLGVMVLCLFLTFLLFSRISHKWLNFALKRIIKKELEVPFLNFGESRKIILFVFYYWIIWLMAFYLFVTAFFPHPDIKVAFAFPLSVTIGVLAIIFPGGLGIREGIMAGFLIMGGVPVTIATVITIYARVWFLSGEVFIFLTAIILRALKKKENVR